MLVDGTPRGAELPWLPLHSQTHPAEPDGWTGSMRLVLDRLRRWRTTLGEVLYGMAVHEMVRHVQRTRGSMEHLFILITLGDLVGVPILPPYYSLRLLPYVVPEINSWKRRLLRERDIVDLLG
jgi:hypothetical protein